MKRLKNLETSVLADMLAEQTAGYLKMIHEGVPETEYYECKYKIMKLQKEINARQQQAPAVTTGSMANPAEKQ